MSSHTIKVITGETIKEVLPSSRNAISKVVEDTYYLHHTGETNNPDSYFLRFEERPRNRIIALPACIRGNDPVSGIKWIASYPDNVASNRQRASAVLVLNDYDTGYPIAFMEAAQISAARTAASATFACKVLLADRLRARTISFIGAGVIARNVADFFISEGWNLSQVFVHDLDRQAAEKLCEYCRAGGYSSAISTSTLDQAIAGGDIVVFATNCLSPYVTEPELFGPGKLVLNLSLRDISEDIIWNASNVFDDVDHCMKANTSPHLAEQKYQSRAFVTGDLISIAKDPTKIDLGKPIIFSPFGLGILDIAVAQLILKVTEAQGSQIEIENFIPDLSRW